MKPVKLIFFILTFISITISGQDAPKGNLVIAGGGMEDNNASVYGQLVDLAGGAQHARFAVIPSASGVPVQSYASFRNTLARYGVDPANILLISVAMIDDDSTETVNEADWKDNGGDEGIARLVRSCTAVWFTGGDQSRTIKALVRPDGSRTAVLKAVWDVYNSGGVIGGTSAGAAIMSEAMIGGGNSLAALDKGVITDYRGDDFPESDGLLMLNGLGFFPHGIVDQHFEQRARFGRLIVALFFERERFTTGFGIDENTALIYFGSKQMIKAAGASGITIFDIRDASYKTVLEKPDIENIKVSYLEDGDGFDLSAGKIIPAEGKKPTRGNEYNEIRNPGQAGILSANSGSFHDLITTSLIDNRGADTVRNISFATDHAGYLVTFYKTPESQGYYTEQPYGEDRYTVENIRMDITPVEINVTTSKEIDKPKN